jgi:hypothetical protein
MNKRRSDAVCTPQTLFDEIAMRPIDWPSKTINLERTSSIEYSHRPISGNVSVAELYHVNSKVSRGSLRYARASDLNLYEVRTEFLRRRAAAVQRRSPAILEHNAALRILLQRSSATKLVYFYAVEIYILLQNKMAVYEPITGNLEVIKELSTDDLNGVRGAARLIAPPNIPPFEGWYLFIVGNFARNEIMLGVRGYRRTLIEVGQVAESLMNSATELDIKVFAIYDFDDRVLEAALDVDGTERSVLVAFELEKGN